MFVSGRCGYYHIPKKFRLLVSHCFIPSFNSYHSYISYVVPKTQEINTDWINKWITWKLRYNLLQELPVPGALIVALHRSYSFPRNLGNYAHCVCRDSTSLRSCYTLGRNGHGTPEMTAIENHQGHCKCFWEEQSCLKQWNDLDNTLVYERLTLTCFNIAFKTIHYMTKEPLHFTFFHTTLHSSFTKQLLSFSHTLLAGAHNQFLFFSETKIKRHLLSLC